MLNLTSPEGLPVGSVAGRRSVDLLGNKAIEIRRVLVTHTLWMAN